MFSMISSPKQNLISRQSKPRPWLPTYFEQRLVCFSVVFILLLLQSVALNAQAYLAPPVQPYEPQKSKVDVSVRDKTLENQRQADEDKKRELEITRWNLMRDTIVAKAESYFARENYDSVLAILSPYVEMNPPDFYFYKVLGISYFKKNMFTAASFCLQRSYNWKSQKEILYYLASSYERIGEDKLAKKYFRKGAREGDEKCMQKVPGDY